MSGLPDRTSVLNTLMVMAPRPSQHPLIRIGGKGDGAYLVPDDLRGITACFSPGVNNVKGFEDELVEAFGIDCHMCDKSSDPDQFKTPLKPGKQTFKKLWLDVNGSADSISLQQWVEELAPNPADDLLLQIDIEGAEYRNILATPVETLRRFRIIVIEVHNLHDILKQDEFLAVFHPFFAKLDDSFQCVHAHPNNCEGDFFVDGIELNIPKVHELTFLRKDRIKLSEPVTGSESDIPHPLDLATNVSSRPPIFLNDFWLQHPRSPASRIQMLETELEFQISRASRASDDARILPFVYGNFQRSILGTLGSEPVVEVAQGKPFVLSSAYPGYAPNGSVLPSNNFFFHTDFGPMQFITVDLLTDYHVRSVVVQNRVHGCQDRARYLFYVIHSSIDIPFNEARPLLGSATGGDFEIKSPSIATSGRYLSIFSPSDTALHFSSLQVFADAPKAA